MSGSWLYQELTDALDNRKDERNAESKILRILRVGSNAKFSLTSDGIYSVITITDDDIIPPFSLTADNSEGLHSSCVLHVQHFHFICRDIYDINNHRTYYLE